MTYKWLPLTSLGVAAGAHRGCVQVMTIASVCSAAAALMSVRAMTCSYEVTNAHYKL